MSGKRSLPFEAGRASAILCGFLMVIVAAGCNDDVAKKHGRSCLDVAEAEHLQGHSFCVMPDSTTETGFRCPEAMPHMHELEDLIVCADSGDLPDGLLDELLGSCARGVDGQCLQEGDGDGQDDVCVPGIIEEVDEADNLTLVGVDEDGDCAPDRDCRLYEYDSAGNRTSSGLDEDCDGSADLDCGVFEYDAAGNLMLTSRYERCDGTAAHCTAYRWDPVGSFHSGYDGNCDGTLDENCATVEFDDGLGAWRIREDDDCDGTPDNACTVAEFDSPDGSPSGWSNLTSQGDDADCDGTPDRDCLVFERDAVGYQTFVGVDADCDGTLDGGCVTWEYNATYSSTRLLLDSDCSGQVCRTSEYGPLNDLIRQGVDQNCDGSLDEDCAGAEYDAAGNREWGWDRDCDGVLDE